MFRSRWEVSQSARRHAIAVAAAAAGQKVLVVGERAAGEAGVKNCFTVAKVTWRDQKELLKATNRLQWLTRS